MAKARSNPFTSDGAMSRAAWKGKTSDEAVRVTAHMRKRPVQNAKGRERGPFQTLDDSDIPDRAFKNAALDAAGLGPQAVTGLDGEPRVNHLKAAVGLLNRRRA